MTNKTLLPYRWMGLALLLAVGLLLGVAGFLSQPAPVYASPERGAPPQSGNPENEMCLGCHTSPGQVLTFSNGDAITISMDANAFNSSVHGDKSCVSCHPNASQVPHPAVTVQSHQAFTTQFDQICASCHQDQSQSYNDSIHAKARQMGKSAPLCTDCHNPHTQIAQYDAQGKMTADARYNISQMCAKCHSTIYQDYANSVHGAGVVSKNNLDVPTCMDCHSDVHKIVDPTSIQARLSSINLCAKCHTNPEIMDKYGISTQVLNTYVADFHGTTIILYKQANPAEQTNKPVCYDCHGVHNIAQGDDPQKGLKIKENLLKTCEKCHPESTLNFPDSWLSHYVPTIDHSPLVYIINMFYIVLIPLVIGGMLVFVISDFIRRQLERRKQHAAPKE